MTFDYQAATIKAGQLQSCVHGISEQLRLLEAGKVLDVDLTQTQITSLEEETKSSGKCAETLAGELDAILSV